MITEIDKKIIEIIAPCMEKTLSEGCIVKTKIKNYKITKVLFYGFQCTDYTGRQFEYILGINGNKTKRISKWEVIGHYDITSALKYIKINGYTIELKENILIIHKFINNFKNIEKIGEISNKPLNLYTETEKQDLYNILLKLKN